MEKEEQDQDFSSPANQNPGIPDREILTMIRGYPDFLIFSCSGIDNFYNDYYNRYC